MRLIKSINSEALLILTGVLMLLASAAFAHAADLPSSGPILPGFTAAKTATSCHMSVGGGIVMADIDTGVDDVGAVSLASRGLAGDLRGGCDIVIPGGSGVSFIVGPWAAIGVGNTDGKGLSGEQDTFWAAGGRAGLKLSSGPVLYAFTAWREQAVDFKIAGQTVAKHDMKGVEFGGGLEVPLTTSIFTAVEIGRVHYDAWIPAAGAEIDIADVFGRARVGYKF